MISIPVSSILSAVGQVLLMGLAGFGLVRRQLLSEAGLDLLTRLLINFFLPQFMFYHFTQDFQFALYPEWWLFPVIGLLMVLGGWLVSQGMVFAFKNISSKKEFMALTIFQNSGYIPLLLVASVFSGEEAHRLSVYILLLLVGFNISMWSLGVWLLTGTQERFPLRHLFNPPLMAMVFSLVFIAVGGPAYLPPMIQEPLKMFSQCVLPIAMIIVGGNLACLKVESILRLDMILVLIAKLILVPLLALGIVFYLKLDFLLGFLVMLQAVVPSAMTLSVIARHYNVQASFINQGIFYSHLVSMVTMPMFLILYIHLSRGMNR